jgi:hypothetical protein
MGSKDWIAVAQDKDRGWALAIALLNFRVQLNTGISLLTKDLLASTEFI